MTFDEYQKQAQKTMAIKINPLMDKTMWVLGISGEAGEIAEKWKKLIAYDNADITDAKKAELAKEMGDVLWYLSAFATSLDISLQNIADENINKVLSRLDRGTIKGKGDNR